MGSTRRVTTCAQRRMPAPHRKQPKPTLALHVIASIFFNKRRQAYGRVVSHRVTTRALLRWVGDRRGTCQASPFPISPRRTTHDSFPSRGSPVNFRKSNTVICTIVNTCMTFLTNKQRLSPNRSHFLHPLWCIFPVSF